MDQVTEPSPVTNTDKHSGRKQTYMDNEPCVGAPKGWKWGYLPCGCCNDGFGRHVYR